MSPVSAPLLRQSPLDGDHPRQIRHDSAFVVIGHRRRGFDLLAAAIETALPDAAFIQIQSSNAKASEFLSSRIPSFESPFRLEAESTDCQGLWDPIREGNNYMYVYLYVYLYTYMCMYVRGHKNSFLKISLGQ